MAEAPPTVHDLAMFVSEWHNRTHGKESQEYRLARTVNLTRPLDAVVACATCSRADVDKPHDLKSTAVNVKLPRAKDQASFGMRVLPFEASIEGEGGSLWINVWAPEGKTWTEDVRNAFFLNKEPLIDGPHTHNETIPLNGTANVAHVANTLVRAHEGHAGDPSAVGVLMHLPKLLGADASVKTMKGFYCSQAQAQVPERGRDKSPTKRVSFGAVAGGGGWRERKKEKEEQLSVAATVTRVKPVAQVTFGGNVVTVFERVKQ